MIHVYHQRIGDMWCATAIEDEKIRATTFSANEQEAQKQLLESLPYNQPFRAEDKPSPLAKEIFHTVESTLAGKDLSWNFKLKRSHLPKYTRKVLDCLAKVPTGYVTTYKALAKTAGGGPRAVGQIMARNPFPPLIPCHRVIKADFSIGGFGGGLGEGAKLKRAMLQREKRGFKKPSEVKTECGFLELFPVEFLRKD